MIHYHYVLSKFWVEFAAKLSPKEKSSEEKCFTCKGKRSLGDVARHGSPSTYLIYEYSGNFD
jgi:hypothetical protein